MADDGHMAQLAIDRKLWSIVVESGFAGRPWDRLLDLIIGVAVGRLRKELRTEQIFQWCAEQNWFLYAPSSWSRADQEDMVQCVIVNALKTFTRDCRAGKGWDPDRDSTLSDYFMGRCRREFANVFRQWLRRDIRDEAGVPLDDVQSAAPDSRPDPARIVLAKEILDQVRTTDVLTPPQRQALFGYAYGLSHEEIARRLNTSAKAVEGLIHRARQQLRKEGIAW